MSEGEADTANLTGAAGDAATPAEDEAPVTENPGTAPPMTEQGAEQGGEQGEVQGDDQESEPETDDDSVPDETP
jgi:hypothetical protein